MINCDRLVKIYETDDKKVMALEGLDLTVETGEMLAVIGKSGSGKSTLAKQLGSFYHAPVLHLDAVHFLPGWVERVPGEEEQLCSRRA